jgi:ribonuclease P protein component
LTERRGARSNTALFRTAKKDGNEADLPAFQNTARATPRLSRAQPYCRRAQGAAQPARARPAPPRALAAADKRFGLGAARRLTQKAQFETLLRHGARRTLDGYTIYVARRDSGTARLGMLISRKHSARAVVRNGIKRCIREAFRLERERLGPLDILVRPPYGARPSAEMILELRDVLGRLKP